MDTAQLDTGLTLLGTPLAHPILLAPTGNNKRYHPEGELATVRGASAGKALSVQAAFASVPIERVGAAARGPIWFQTFVFRDRQFTLDLARRAIDAGTRALVLTVDLPMRLLHGSEDSLSQPTSGSLTGLQPIWSEPPAPRLYDPYLDPSLTWEALDWLKSMVSVPVLVKGVLRPDQAAIAIEHGAAAIIVSNHGARNLDTVPATIDALPPMVKAVAGRVPILIDGGFRRGTDVAKALILGATAVLIGRPYLWGLGAAGADGVRQAIDLLRNELETAMRLLGAPTLADLTADLLWAEPTQLPTLNQ